MLYSSLRKHALLNTLCGGPSYKLNDPTASILTTTTLFFPLQRLVRPLAGHLDAAELEQLGDGAAALDLADKVLELGAVGAAGNVGLDARLQHDAHPVGVALRALDQHLRRQLTLNVDVPLANADAVVLGDDRAGDLVAGAETGQRVDDGRGRRVRAAEKGVRVGREGVRLAGDRELLDGAGAGALDLDGNALEGRWGAREGAAAVAGHGAEPQLTAGGSAASQRGSKDSVHY
jgi:hypothetical protein